MNFVLFHMGNKLPTHIKYCIKQIKYTNPGHKIYFLTNLDIKIPRNENNVEIINIGEFDVPNISNYFQHDQANIQLWQTAVYRLFYLEEFIKKYSITDVIHFDNDILLYSDLEKFESIFKKFNFLITPHFETEYVFGFSYIKDYKVLTPINKELFQLTSLNKQELENLVNHRTPHEMRLLNFINQKNNMELIDHLPVVVESDGSDNFDLFNAVFDPSTYGKHVAGSHCMGPHNEHYVSTPKWHGTENHHYAGKQLADGRIDIDFDGKIPFIGYNNNQYELVNLHVHNKNLDQFVLC